MLAAILTSLAIAVSWVLFILAGFDFLQVSCFELTVTGVCLAAWGCSLKERAETAEVKMSARDEKLYFADIEVQKLRDEVEKLRLRAEQSDARVAALESQLAAAESSFHEKSSELSVYLGEKSALSRLSYSDLQRIEDQLQKSQSAVHLYRESVIAKRLQSSETALCAVCLERKLEVLFRPCNHFCCCDECGEAMKECPICRRAIARKEKIFRSK